MPESGMQQAEMYPDPDNAAIKKRPGFDSLSRKDKSGSEERLEKQKAGWSCNLTSSDPVLALVPYLIEHAFLF